MPSTHRVIITGEALSDPTRITAYIRQTSPQNAALVADRIVQAMDSLNYLPDRFKQVGRSRKRGSPVHGMVVKPFIVYYRVDPIAHYVFILNIIHGARRQPRHFN
jgi:plasmid stabilization system protein ParE